MPSTNVKEFYERFMEDPDYIGREALALAEAEQRVRQSINNHQALSMAKAMSPMEELLEFLIKKSVEDNVPAHFQRNRNNALTNLIVPEGDTEASHQDLLDALWSELLPLAPEGSTLEDILADPSLLSQGITAQGHQMFAHTERGEFVGEEGILEPITFEDALDEELAQADVSEVEADSEDFDKAPDEEVDEAGEVVSRGRQEGEGVNVSRAAGTGLPTQADYGTRLSMQEEEDPVPKGFKGLDALNELISRAESPEMRAQLDNIRDFVIDFNRNEARYVNQPVVMGRNPLASPGETTTRPTPGLSAGRTGQTSYRFNVALEKGLFEKPSASKASVDTFNSTLAHVVDLVNKTPEEGGYRGLDKSHTWPKTNGGFIRGYNVFAGKPDEEGRYNLPEGFTQADLEKELKSAGLTIEDLHDEHGNINSNAGLSDEGIKARQLQQQILQHLQILKGGPGFTNMYDALDALVEIGENPTQFARKDISGEPVIRAVENARGNPRYALTEPTTTQQDPESGELFDRPTEEESQAQDFASYQNSRTTSLEDLHEAISSLSEASSEFRHPSGNSERVTHPISPKQNYLLNNVVGGEGSLQSTKERSQRLIDAVSTAYNENPEQYMTYKGLNDLINDTAAELGFALPEVSHLSQVERDWIGEKKPDGSRRNAPRKESPSLEQDDLSEMSPRDLQRMSENNEITLEKYVDTINQITKKYPYKVKSDIIRQAMFSGAQGTPETDPGLGSDESDDESFGSDEIEEGSIDYKTATQDGKITAGGGLGGMFRVNPAGFWDINEPKFLTDPVTGEATSFIQEKRVPKTGRLEADVIGGTDPSTKEQWNPPPSKSRADNLMDLMRPNDVTLSRDPITNAEVMPDVKRRPTDLLQDSLGGGFPIHYAVEHQQDWEQWKGLMELHNSVGVPMDDFLSIDPKTKQKIWSPESMHHGHQKHGFLNWGEDHRPRSLPAEGKEGGTSGTYEQMYSPRATEGIAPFLPGISMGTDDPNIPIEPGDSFQSNLSHSASKRRQAWIKARTPWQLEKAKKAGGLNNILKSMRNHWNKALHNKESRRAEDKIGKESNAADDPVEDPFNRTRQIHSSEDVKDLGIYDVTTGRKSIPRTSNFTQMTRHGDPDGLTDSKYYEALLDTMADYQDATAKADPDNMSTFDDVDKTLTGVLQSQGYIPHPEGENSPHSNVISLDSISDAFPKDEEYTPDRLRTGVSSVDPSKGSIQRAIKAIERAIGLATVNNFQSGKPVKFQRGEWKDTPITRKRFPGGKEDIETIQELSGYDEAHRGGPDGQGINTLRKEGVTNHLGNPFDLKDEVPESRGDYPEAIKSAYVNHSGGAEGADKDWDFAGRSYGVTANHYHMQGAVRRGHLHTHDLSRENQAAVDARLDKVNSEVLKRGASKGYHGMSQFVKDNVRRNALGQVDNADGIFAISTIGKKGRGSREGIVDGGTGWAVHLAIQEGKQYKYDTVSKRYINKPVYVFDQVDNKWYEWDYGKNEWAEYKNEATDNTPTLTPHFAGIGTREINTNGNRAIRDVYRHTFGGDALEHPTDSSVRKFEEWLRGTDHHDVEPERRQAILDRIESGELNGQRLDYYTKEHTDAGRPSHADVLAKLVNETKTTRDQGVQGFMKALEEHPAVLNSFNALSQKDKQYIFDHFFPQKEGLGQVGGTIYSQHGQPFRIESVNRDTSGYYKGTMTVQQMQVAPENYMIPGEMVPTDARPRVLQFKEGTEGKRNYWVDTNTRWDLALDKPVGDENFTFYSSDPTKPSSLLSWTHGGGNTGSGFTAAHAAYEEAGGAASAPGQSDISPREHILAELGYYPDARMAFKENIRNLVNTLLGSGDEVDRVDLMQALEGIASDLGLAGIELPRAHEMSKLGSTPYEQTLGELQKLQEFYPERMTDEDKEYLRLLEEQAAADEEEDGEGGIAGRPAKPSTPGPGSPGRDVIALTDIPLDKLGSAVGSSATGLSTEPDQGGAIALLERELPATKVDNREEVNHYAALNNGWGGTLGTDNAHETAHFAHHAVNPTLYPANGSHPLANLGLENLTEETEEGIKPHTEINNILGLPSNSLVTLQHVQDVAKSQAGEEVAGNMKDAQDFLDKARKDYQDRSISDRETISILPGGTGDIGGSDVPLTTEGAGDEEDGYSTTDEAVEIVRDIHSKQKAEGSSSLTPEELGKYKNVMGFLQDRLKDGKVTIIPDHQYFGSRLSDGDRHEIIDTFNQHNKIMTDLEPMGDEFPTIPEEAPPAEDDADAEEAPDAFKAAYSDQWKEVPKEDEVFEVSTKGNDLGKQFSAKNATLPNGRTIEDVYQDDIKGGVGKGRLPEGMSKEDLHKAYTDLWREWADANPEKLAELAEATRGKTLVDRFAYSTGTGVSQAHSLAEILNERHGTSPEAPPEPADERGEPEDFSIQMADLDNVLSNHHENTQHSHMGQEQPIKLSTGQTVQLSDMAYGPGGKRMLQVTVKDRAGNQAQMGAYFSKSDGSRAEGTDGKWVPLEGFSAEGTQGTEANSRLLPHATWRIPHTIETNHEPFWDALDSFLQTLETEGKLPTEEDFEAAGWGSEAHHDGEFVPRMEAHDNSRSVMSPMAANTFLGTTASRAANATINSASDEDKANPDTSAGRHLQVANERLERHQAGGYKSKTTPVEEPEVEEPVEEPVDERDRDAGGGRGPVDGDPDPEPSEEEDPVAAAMRRIKDLHTRFEGAAADRTDEEKQTVQQRFWDELSPDEQEQYHTDRKTLEDAQSQPDLKAEMAEFFDDIENLHNIASPPERGEEEEREGPAPDDVQNDIREYLKTQNNWNAVYNHDKVGGNFVYQNRITEEVMPLFTSLAQAKDVVGKFNQFNIMHKNIEFVRISTQEARNQDPETLHGERQKSLNDMAGMLAEGNWLRTRVGVDSAQLAAGDISNPELRAETGLKYIDGDTLAKHTRLYGDSFEGVDIEDPDALLKVINGTNGFLKEQTRTWVDKLEQADHPFEVERGISSTPHWFDPSRPSEEPVSLELEDKSTPHKQLYYSDEAGKLHTETLERLMAQGVQPIAEEDLPWPGTAQSQKGRPFWATSLSKEIESLSDLVQIADMYKRYPQRRQAATGTDGKGSLVQQWIFPVGDDQTLDARTDAQRADVVKARLFMASQHLKMILLYMNKHWESDLHDPINFHIGQDGSYYYHPEEKADPEQLIGRANAPITGAPLIFYPTGMPENKPVQFKTGTEGNQYIRSLMREDKLTKIESVYDAIASEFTSGLKLLSDYSTEYQSYEAQEGNDALIEFLKQELGGLVFPANFKKAFIERNRPDSRDPNKKISYSEAMLGDTDDYYADPESEINASHPMSPGNQMLQNLSYHRMAFTPQSGTPVPGPHNPEAGELFDRSSAVKYHPDATIKDEQFSWIGDNELFTFRRDLKTPASNAVKVSQVEGGTWKVGAHVLEGSGAGRRMTPVSEIGDADLWEKSKRGRERFSSDPDHDLHGNNFHKLIRSASPELKRDIHHALEVLSDPAAQKDPEFNEDTILGILNTSENGQNKSRLREIIKLSDKFKAKTIKQQQEKDIKEKSFQRAKHWDEIKNAPTLLDELHQAQATDADARITPEYATTYARGLVQYVTNLYNHGLSPLEDTKKDRDGLTLADKVAKINELINEAVKFGADIQAIDKELETWGRGEGVDTPFGSPEHMEAAVKQDKQTRSEKDHYDSLMDPDSSRGAWDDSSYEPEAIHDYREGPTYDFAPPDEGEQSAWDSERESLRANKRHHQTRKDDQLSPEAYDSQKEEHEKRIDDYDRYLANYERDLRHIDSMNPEDWTGTGTDREWTDPNNPETRQFMLHQNQAHYGYGRDPDNPPPTDHDGEKAAREQRVETARKKVAEVRQDFTQFETDHGGESDPQNDLDAATQALDEHESNPPGGDYDRTTERWEPLEKFYSNFGRHRPITGTAQHFFNSQRKARQGPNTQTSFTPPEVLGMPEEHQSEYRSLHNDTIDNPDAPGLSTRKDALRTNLEATGHAAALDHPHFGVHGDDRGQVDALTKQPPKHPTSGKQMSFLPDIGWADAEMLQGYQTSLRNKEGIYHDGGLIHDEDGTVTDKGLYIDKHGFHGLVRPDKTGNYSHANVGTLTPPQIRHHDLGHKMDHALASGQGSLKNSPVEDGVKVHRFSGVGHPSTWESPPTKPSAGKLTPLTGTAPDITPNTPPPGQRQGRGIAAGVAQATREARTSKMPFLETMSSPLDYQSAGKTAKDIWGGTGTGVSGTQVGAQGLKGAARAIFKPTSTRLGAKLFGGGSPSSPSGPSLEKSKLQSLELLDDYIKKSTK